MNTHAGYCSLVGRPNVGKSTLLNRLLGQKLAITSHKPQTTRHSIMGVFSHKAGQIVFVDTPGMHQRGQRAMNRYLNKTAQTALADADLAVFVVQAPVWNEEDARTLEAIKARGVDCILAVNKIDTLKPREKLLPYLEALAERHDFKRMIPVSALSGENVDTLRREVLTCLPVAEAIFPEDQLTDRPEKFFAAELLREQIVRRYHEELPYVVSVEIERFVETPERYEINAVVWVERENQRAILLGKGGKAMKETATAARKQMAKFFQSRVHLEVWIKVKKSWSSDEASLNQLGYTDR